MPARGETIIKLVVFDQDGVLVSPKSTWKIVKDAYGIEDIYPAKDGFELSPEEEHTLELGLMIAKGVSKRDFERVGCTAQIEPHAEEVISQLFSMGIEVHIATLSPDAIARIVASRINKKFKENNFARVHAPFALFDLNGKLVDIIAYPNIESELEERVWRGTEMDKAEVILNIAKKLNINPEEVIFVSDGHDVDAAKRIRTLAYKSEDPELRKYAAKEISDLREVLEYIKQQNFMEVKRENFLIRSEKQKLL